MGTDDPREWPDYREEFARSHTELHAGFDAFCQERGAPRELDYARSQPLGATWHNLEASVRTTDDAWELPEPLASQEGPLVYVSLGSLASGTSI
jgi:hypothetical protein